MTDIETPETGPSEPGSTGLDVARGLDRHSGTVRKRVAAAGSAKIAGPAGWCGRLMVEAQGDAGLIKACQKNMLPVDRTSCRKHRAGDHVGQPPGIKDQNRRRYTAKPPVGQPAIKGGEAIGPPHDCRLQVTEIGV